MNGPMQTPAPRMSFDYVVHAGFFLLVAGAVWHVLTLTGFVWYCMVVLALCAVLATLYVGGQAWWHRMGRWRPGWLAALLLVWAVLTAMAPAFAWAAVPLACCVVRALPRIAAAGAVAAVTGMVVLAQTRHAGFDPDAVVAPAVAVCAVAALYHRQLCDNALRQELIDDLVNTRTELAESQRQAGVLGERSRLAREIHDTLAQDLASTRLLLQAAERDWNRRPETSLAHVQHAVKALGDGLIEARRFISDLMPPELDDADLDAALLDLCARLTAEGTLKASFRVTGRRWALSPEVAATLLRVAQGALANVREHAAARQVLATLSYHDHAVALELRDDGVGFSPAQAAAGRVGGRGFGLTAMRNRLDIHGGTLAVERAAGAGTTLTATIPVRGVPAPAEVPYRQTGRPVGAAS